MMQKFLTICSSYLEANQHGKVIKCCDDYLSMEPKSGLAWHLKGIAHQKQGQIGKADECFRKAIEIDEGEPANYRALGVLFYNSKKYEEALILFHISNFLAPKVDHQFMIVISNLMLKRPEAASLAMRAALTMDKKKTAGLAKQFFDKFYKDDNGIPEEDKKALKEQIDNLLESK